MAINKTYLEELERLFSEIKLINEEELPSVRRNLKNAQEMLQDFDATRREPRARLRYITQRDFYQKQEEQLEKELEEYCKKRDNIVESILYGPYTNMGAFCP